MAAVIRAIEARYPGTRGVVDRWTHPEGDKELRWWVTVLNVRARDLGPLREFATQLAVDLYGPDPKPFVLSSTGKREARRFLDERAAREREERARTRRGRKPGADRRSRRRMRA